MRLVRKRGVVILTPLAVSAALVLSACGGGGSDSATGAQQAPDAATAPVADAPVSAVDGATGATAPVAAADPAAGAAPVAGGAGAAPVVATKSKGKSAPAEGATKARRSAAGGGATGGLTSIDNAAQAAENARIAEQKDGATDIGVTKDSIKLGTINMHGLALGNLFVKPLVNGLQATVASINDRGGVLGRRLSLVDCDDGSGEVTRSKACIKKMVGQDKIFSMLSYSSWASASVHSDLAQYRLPAIGTWAYSQTEWQDPYMFPTHMSMIHEAMANANWVRNVIKPKTYGMICLTSPEMQLACDQIQTILDASGVNRPGFLGGS